MEPKHSGNLGFWRGVRNTIKNIEDELLKIKSGIHNQNIKTLCFEYHPGSGFNITQVSSNLYTIICNSDNYSFNFGSMNPNNKIIDAYIIVQYKSQATNIIHDTFKFGNNWIEPMCTLSGYTLNWRISGYHSKGIIDTPDADFILGALTLYLCVVVDYAN